jgi:predicted CDP-diglyceride synthetase/phosphatidate cytidylyltransferase
MHALTVAQLLVLLTLANGSPIVAKLILGDHFSSPLDLGKKFIDGKPLLGPTKTIRGLLIAIAVTAACAPLLGLGFEIGLLVGATAMAGDLSSSFVKRRFGWPASSRATGLDQIPESLLPLLACRDALSLTAVDVLVVCALFFVGEVLLSRLLFRFRVRDQPY